MMRAGLRALLEGETIEVTADAASLFELSMEMSNADVLVVAGAALTEDSLASLSRDDAGLMPAIVALAENEQPAAALRRLPLRGWGILSPDAPASELQAAVVSVSQGLVVLSLPLAVALIGPRQMQTLEGGALPEPLTAREMEVLELLSQGLSNKLIARQLSISEHTVKFHVSSIYTKLNAASRTDAVSRGARLGLITL